MRTSSIARPGVSIRRGADRHQTRIDWLHGRHSFDTGIDPLGADTHHGVLVSNHDTIAPRAGFETHPHRNMEIVTWVLNGSLVHQDSEGHAGVIYPNLAQRMTASTGIRHSEKNDRPAVNPLRRTPRRATRPRRKGHHPGCAVRSRLPRAGPDGPRSGGHTGRGGRRPPDRGRRAPPRCDQDAAAQAAPGRRRAAAGPPPGGTPRTLNRTASGVRRRPVSPARRFIKRSLRRARIDPVDHQPALGEEPLPILPDEFIKIADGRDHQHALPVRGDRKVMGQAVAFAGGPVPVQ